MHDREKNLEKIVNASGFVFQMALEHRIRSTRDKHNWEILAREHPWRDHDSEHQGYIDLIIKHGRMRMVIECKRPKDAAWIFLNPNKKRDEVRRSRLLWARITSEVEGTIIDKTTSQSKNIYRSIAGWSDLAITEESPESEFCVVRGQGEDSKTMLERLCDQLLCSIECLAKEEIQISEYKDTQDVIIYIPAIVTTAKLELCHFDPDKIDLSNGLMSQGTFTTVPFIRFRKSLTTKLTSTIGSRDIGEANQESERTVLIINSDYFCDLLKNIHVERLDSFSQWPWRVY